MRPNKPSIAAILVVTALVALLLGLAFRGRGRGRASRPRASPTLPRERARPQPRAGRLPPARGPEAHAGDIRPTRPAPPDEARGEPHPLERLLAASDRDLPDLLETLAASAAPSDREAVARALALWLRDHHLDLVRRAARALLVQGSGGGGGGGAEAALATIQGACAKAAGSRGADPLFEAAGYQIGDLLAGRYRDEALPPGDRRALLLALVRSGRTTTEEGAALLVAVALGGATEADREAVHQLAAMARDAGGAGGAGGTAGTAGAPGIRAAAAERLGRIATAGEMLDLTGLDPTRAPRDPQEAVVLGAFVEGLHQAVVRHPEDLPATLPLFRTILEEQHGTPERDAVRTSLLERLARTPVPGLEGALRAVAREESPRAATLARKALRAIEPAAR